MENQPKLNSSKEVITFLAERFPHCFSAEGEARPLKIGIFQDLVERVQGEMGLSKTQLRSALRLYTSSWRYLYGIKAGAVRVDLDGNACGVLHAVKQAKVKRVPHRVVHASPRRVSLQKPMLRVNPVRRRLLRVRPPHSIASQPHVRSRKPDPSLIPQLCNPARVLKLKQAKVRWTLPFLKYLKTAFGSSSLPAWQ